MPPVAKKGGVQWSEEEWQSWAKKQTLKQLTKQFQASLLWLKKQSQSRLPQYFAVWAIVLVVAQPAVQGAVGAVTQFFGSQSLQLAKAVKAVAVLEAVRAVTKVVQWGQSLLRSLAQVEQTSQVCATRANAEEWRNALEFASKWHQCPLQAAYKLWQLRSQSVPACPAKQWKLLPQGQPLQVLDQITADSAIPEDLQSLLDIDKNLSAVHEKWLLKAAGKQQFTAEQSKVIDETEAVYQEFRQQCLRLDVSRKEDLDTVPVLVQAFSKWIAAPSSSEGQGTSASEAKGQ